MLYKEGVPLWIPGTASDLCICEFHKLILECGMSWFLVSYCRKSTNYGARDLTSSSGISETSYSEFCLHHIIDEMGRRMLMKMKRPKPL